MLVKTPRLSSKISNKISSKVSNKVTQRIQRHCNPDPRPSATSTPRILCVDDDPDMQTSLELRMRDYNVDMDHAYYGMQGVVEAVKKNPDLILMDLAMPNGDGEYLLDCIKKNQGTVHIPVIVLTGMRNPALKSRLLNSGAEVFLQKPVQFEELLHQMSRFVDIEKRDG